MSSVEYPRRLEEVPGMTQMDFEDAAFAASVIIGLAEMAGMPVSEAATEVGYQRFRDDVFGFAFVDCSFPLEDVIRELAQQVGIQCKLSGLQTNKEIILEKGENIARMAEKIAELEDANCMAVYVMLLSADTEAES